MERTAIGSTIAWAMVMRLLPLVMIAALSLAPGCAVLVVPPAIGAGGGLLVAGAEQASGGRPSFATHTVIGVVAGLVVDALLVAVAINSFDNALQRWGD